MSDVWDAIVVGAGIGGLTCAAYLAASGRRTLVVESHDVAGGCAQVFRRKGRYEFDVGAHYLGGYGPGGRSAAVLRGLGLVGRFTVEPLNPDGFDRIRAPGLAFDTPVGWAAYRRRLHDTLPGEAAAVDIVIDELRRQAAAGPAGGWWSRRSLAELFAHAGLSARGRTAVGAQTFNLGGDPAGLAVPAYAAMLDHYLSGAYRPAGGGQMLVAALVESIEAHGGEVLTRTTAERILIEDGRVVGVRLAGGRSPGAPVVVSGADYRHTMRDLIGYDRLPEGPAARARRATFSATVANVFVGVDGDPGWPDDVNYWIFDSTDPDDVWSSLERVPFALVTLASSRAEPGRRALQIMTATPPSEPGRFPVAYRRDPAYLAEKQRLLDRMLDLAESELGPIRPLADVAEASTGLTHTRYTAAADGSAFGLSSSPRQWGSLRPDYRGPVGGLFLAGASARRGPGFCGAGLGGVECAGEILGRPLLDEIMAGAVLADPGRLPRRGPDFDPLRVSRGRGRAHRRAAPGPAYEPASAA